ncbi:MAG: hypothetical protein HYY50_05150 [Candidatus Kerfeldbacteria bacterium]|nr:hypothetical protein [Candidatus Kerfeldbacteria bacterium]
MSSRLKIVIPLVAVAIIGGALFLLKDRIAGPLSNGQGQNSNQPPSGSQGQPTIVRSVSISYPRGWVAESLTSADKLAGLIVKAHRENPTASFSARSIVGELEANINVAAAADQVVESLTKEIENFTLVSNKTLNTKSYRTIQIRYKQQSSRDQTVTENLLTILLTRNQTFYLSLRSAEADYRAIESETQQLILNFATYLNSQGLQ